MFFSMEDPLIIENAIRRFYSTGENEAHQWLLQFQNSDAAWDYVWLLLNPAKVLTIIKLLTNLKNNKQNLFEINFNFQHLKIVV